MIDYGKVKERINKRLKDLKIFKKEKFDTASSCVSCHIIDTEIRPLVDALDKIDHELGRVEGLGVPSPIYNASEIAQNALTSLGYLNGGDV